MVRARGGWGGTRWCSEHGAHEVRVDIDVYRSGSDTLIVGDEGDELMLEERIHDQIAKMDWD